jgi:hypothetical protein
MNLAKLFAAGLCLTALTAPAAMVKTNAFENGETQTGWFVGTNDTLSTRSVTNDSINGRSAYAGTTPLTGTANERVLKLDTEGAIWTNQVNASFESNPLYTDMLVKFVPSEDLPTFVPADGGKFAIAIKANAGGTNVLNLANNNGSSFSWSETAQEISTSLWYRVTVKFYVEGESTLSQVYVNGSAVGSPLLMNADINYTSIGFQGTGYIDEVVIRDDDPFAAGGAILTLQFATGIGSVYVGAVPKTSGQTVTSGQSLIIAAANFYEIASVTGAGTSWVVGGINETGGVVTVTSATNATVTITAQAETSTTPYAGSGAFSNAPANTVAAWAIANGVSALSDPIYNNYLLNIDDQATVPALLIKSIAVTNPTVTVTVEATGVNFTQINGTLKLVSYPTLGGTPTTHSISFSGTTTATIQQNIGTNKFVKARVE